MAFKLASRTLDENLSSLEDAKVFNKSGKEPDENDEVSWLSDRMGNVSIVKHSPVLKAEELPNNDIHKEASIKSESENAPSFEPKLEINKMEVILAELSIDFATKTNINSVEKKDESGCVLNELSPVCREVDEDEECCSSDDELQARGPPKGTPVLHCPNLDPDEVGNFFFQLSPNSLSQQDSKVVEQAQRNRQFLAEQSVSSRKFRRPNDSEESVNEAQQQPTTEESSMMQQFYVHPSAAQVQAPHLLNAQDRMMPQSGMPNNWIQPITMQMRNSQPIGFQQECYQPIEAHSSANHQLRNTTQHTPQVNTIKSENYHISAIPQNNAFHSISATQLSKPSVSTQSQNFPSITTLPYNVHQPINIPQQALQPRQPIRQPQNYPVFTTQLSFVRQPTDVFPQTRQSILLPPQNNSSNVPQQRSLHQLSFASHATKNVSQFYRPITATSTLSQPYVQNVVNEHTFDEQQIACDISLRNPIIDDFEIQQTLPNDSSLKNHHCLSIQNNLDSDSVGLFFSLVEDFDESLIDELMRGSDDDLNAINIESLDSLIENLKQSDVPEFVPLKMPVFDACNSQESKEISNINGCAPTRPLLSCSDSQTLQRSPGSTPGHSPRSFKNPSNEFDLPAGYPLSAKSHASEDSGYHEETGINDVTSNIALHKSIIPLSVEEIAFDFDNPSTQDTFDETGRLIVPKPPTRRGGPGSRGGCPKNRKQVIAPCNEKHASVAGNGKHVHTNDLNSSSNPFMKTNTNGQTGNAEQRNCSTIPTNGMPFVSTEQAHTMMTNFNFGQAQELNGVSPPFNYQPGHGDGQRKKLQAIKPRPMVPPRPVDCQPPRGAAAQSTTAVPQQLQQQDIRIYRQLAGMTTDKLIQADKDGDTILHIAISRGENKFVEALLDRLERAGLLVKIMQTVNHHLQTPLFLAVMMNNAVIVRQLINRGADVNELIQKRITSESGLNHFRLLHYAASKGSSFVSTLQELLNTPCIDVNARNSQGLTPLHFTINSHGNRISSVNDGIIDSMPAIFLLAEHGANLNMPDGLNGKTPLHYIIEKRNAKLTSWFLELITHVNPVHVQRGVSGGVLGGVSGGFPGGVSGRVPGDVSGSGIDILCNILMTRTSVGLTPVQLVKIQQCTPAERYNLVQILLAAEARVEKLKMCRLSAMNGDTRDDAVKIC